MERRTRKSVAALAGRLPACDPARPRNAGAGFGSEGRRRAAWNQAWAPRLPGMGCDLSAVAGLPWDWRRRRGGNDGAFPSRGAVVRIGTAFPAPLAANMRTGSRWRDGSPCGTATVLRSTSVGRRRTADAGLRGEGGAHRADRRCDRCRKTGKTPGQLLESLAHADQLDPLDVEGVLALRSISQRCAERIGDAARILEAQNEILYAEERTV